MALRDCAEQGIHHIRIVPLFFGVGKHVAEDLQGLVEAIRAEFVEIAIRNYPHARWGRVKWYVKRWQNMPYPFNHRLVKPLPIKIIHGASVSGCAKSLLAMRVKSKRTISLRPPSLPQTP